MAWQSLTIRTDEQTADALSDILLELGALSTGIEDAAAGTGSEQPIYGEPGAPDPALWRHSLISALFPADADMMQIIAAAGRETALDLAASYSVEPLEDLDWVRLTQSQFDPIRISPRLWIVPTWHTPPDAGAVNLILDPGVAFGTGSHPTTRLCLQWLDEHLSGGERILDYGCGSGILAIAAAKLGAAQVTGIDIDPQAVLASRQNAARNQVDAVFFLPDDAPATPADILLANILSAPLTVLAPALAAAVQQRGRIVLSGILADQAEAVMAAYHPWFTIARHQEAEGWVCLVGVRR